MIIELLKLQVYTKFFYVIYSKITWIILLKISKRKNTKWWLVGAENKNHGVLNASSKCSNLVLATIERVLR